MNKYLQMLSEHQANIENEFKLIINEMKKVGVEKLPYAYASLKPFIDERTMEIHYTKHYKGYVDKLNKAIKDKDINYDLEGIVKHINRFNKTIRNNAGGAFNHALFWKMLSPKKKEIPEELEKNIIRYFVSIKNFKTKFELVAQKRFGSGWVWLVLTKTNRLKIMSTPNQDNPLMNIIRNGGFPILGLDLWEHSYYLKYQSNRDEYIKNFWDCINWDFVYELFQKHKQQP